MASAFEPQGGHLVPPLNITAPTPGINLNNFQWKTLDDKLHPQSIEGAHVDGLTIDQKSISANGQKVFSREAAAAGPSPDAVQLPPQLAGQIGLLDTKPRPRPAFPLERFQGAYKGNGFNLIFRPKPNDNTQGLTGLDTGTDPKNLKLGPNTQNDNILELNITTEQLSFGGTIDNIPNRGSATEGNITLMGVPYLQTVQDVTNPPTGKGDHADRDWGIHFEPGVWLNVPAASFQDKQASIVRMASIPHGTTINAQGFAPPRRADTMTGGEKVGPKIEDIDTTPFFIGNPASVDDIRKKKFFTNMNEENNADLRIPQNLDSFGKGKDGSKRITTEIIKNPNSVLKDAIHNLQIDETITFTVATGPENISNMKAEDKAKIPADKVAANKAAADKLNGGGTTNIAFLEGDVKANPRKPNALAARMTATYWIERVMYDITIPGGMLPGRPTKVLPKMPAGCTAPTPEFLIIPGRTGHPIEESKKVPGTQIQVSQNVTLNFAGLSWPHVSVSTLVPSDPQIIDLSRPESEWGKL